ncbi:MAG: DnaJ C-terminal domain-containing protein [Thermoguttaceae bacterium]
MAEDYYSILGVPKNASPAEIQKAYRELARKHHPDMNPGDKTAKKKFQKVQAAFDVLNNPEKREMYDRYGSSFETAGQGGPQGAHTWSWTPGAGAGPSAGPGGFGAEDIDLSQFLGERFGQEMPGGLGDLFGQFRRAAGRARKSAGGGQQTPRRGGDLLQEIQIPFTTSITGGEVQLAVQRSPQKTETLAVKIPAGIEDGKKIRIRGHGQPAPRGGTPGDILLTIRVQPHPFFHRKGNQLHVRVPVTLGEAVAGAKVDVPTPRGMVVLRIPPNSSSGMKLRVKGHGVAPKNGAAGDLFAEIQIVLPKELSDADRQTIQQIDQRYAQSPRSELRW